MATIPKDENGKIPELQLVRAMAIICVLSVHASASATVAMKESGYYYFYNFINIFMKIGTPTFILLSSFVLFYSYYSRPIDIKLIAGFYKKRLLYIMIPYVVFSAVYFLLTQRYGHHPILSRESLLLFGQKLIAGKAFAHLYFVFISIQFYLLFPLLLAAVQRWKAIARWLVPLGFAVQWGFVLLNKYAWQVPDKGSWSLSYFSFFMLGAAMGIYYPKIKNGLLNRNNQKRKVRAYRIGWSVIWSVWLMLSMAHVTIYFNARSYGTRYDSLWYELLWNFQCVFAALALFQAAFFIQKYWPGFVSRPLHRLGQYSFGIYLIHLLFLLFYDRYMPGFGISWPSHFRYLGSWLVMLGASWATVELAARFVPFAWIGFGNLPRSAEASRHFPQTPTIQPHSVP
ncbi:acyltransferase [Cohnella faecalis]|uniref:Acyltransferase n=1 Tax=Cohnella faecalis TaxID=2315694 RepID=A0A398CPS3_9BACL|nr:acyltransferase [Cohnella faecalis]RIE04535.1 acyltransferase [Cohnella faecalis]